MREKHLKETGLADMAFKVEQDHEVQMARAELYKLAKYAIKLHEMLKGVSEQQGLEGWVQAKITKAADYVSSVYHHMDYETKFEEVTESNKSIVEGIDSPIVTMTIPNTTPDMAEKMERIANEKNIEFSKQGNTVFLKGKRIDMTMLTTKMAIAQTNIPMVPVEPKRGTPGNPIGMSKDQMADPANQDLMQKARRMDALGDSVNYKGFLSSLLEEKVTNKLSEKVEMCPKACCGKPVTECSCGPDCKHCDCYEKNKAMKESKNNLCEDCGKEKLTKTEMTEIANLEEGKKHGNSKVYDKCWKGCRKVAGKKRGEPGSCKCD